MVTVVLHVVIDIFSHSVKLLWFIINLLTYLRSISNKKIEMLNHKKLQKIFVGRGCSQLDKMLSYRRETALRRGVISFGKNVRKACI